ncbi:outer membrane beta-barrel protein [Dyadobacter sp. CY347]|uniref:outer membrane beta-barrel protein n=1 Tax=Dyadobacter sp. CY347 TaxID=2909336 RepID=UPI001F2D8AC7|nr:outer membrane beta-barrel protein [Dyadobacter sp. CY347]MCF2488014.1 PorT family protein [Dyadobacter sp. CY347]
MKKKLFLHLVAMLLLQTVAMEYVYAQGAGKWNFGVSVGLTSERFKVTRDFKNQTQVVSTQAYNVSSWSNFGGALWAERMLSPTWSLVPQFGYQIVRIKDNVLSGGLSKSGSGDDLKETHHYVSLALHLRKYFVSNSRLRLFADAGIKADRLVCFKNEYWRYNNETWKPTLLNNINPAIIFATGIRRGRWSLSAEYQYFLGTPLVKKYRGNSVANGVKTDLERQSLAVKAAFTILK